MQARPLHTLLLLADSALPLGSFAFSSGLESYLAHHRPATSSASQVPAFHHFLRLSLHTLASTALPYVLAGHRSPHLIETLDNDLDASTPCTVARRASVAQGRALLAVWDRSFKNTYHQQQYASSSAGEDDNGNGDALAALARFQAGLRAATRATPLPPNAHLAPLWGLLTRVLGVDPHESAYLFLFSHARTVTSAAVRASVLGPYQAQAVLADAGLRERVGGLVKEFWDTPVEDAGQSVPLMDLWVGRHEKLYSRIFNS
ncbi:putative urease accessory protein [Diplodia seriata]|uniref:Putative urease accessory protein n=1 Tax=Diplodia seriata TaxID=420778 RepID=A0A0G2EEA5_9PEZI|nr:putative urease accessory protein [Diplodia seriata]